ncbi:15396_t:CDS:2, partial [Cetraspora pellucida]
CLQVTLAPVGNVGTTAAGFGPLPSGWEQRTAPEGRPYFVDNNIRTTAWQQPVSQLGPLPSGQEMYLTSTTRRISKRVEDQFKTFMENFNQQDLISVFDEHELELLIGGIAEIDVDNWKRPRIYRIR